MARPRIIGLLLGLLTLLVYLPVWNNGFIAYDDPDYLVENRMVQSGLTWAGVKWAFTTWHADNWHPLTWLSHMLDCELFGPEAGAHHFMNVLLHAACALVLFQVWRRLTGDLWPAALVAALFAWHPLHVESVAWASERKDVLSTLFGLLTLWAYVGYAAPTANRHSNRRTLYGAAVLCFVLSLLAKPMLVTLPFVLVLLDWWPLRRLSGSQPDEAGPHPAWFPQLSVLVRLLAEKLPFLVLSAASCVITYLAQREQGAVVSLEESPLALRCGNAVVAYARYLLKMIWPFDLAVVYPLPRTLNGSQVALAGLVLLLISAWVLKQGRRPHLLVGWLWYLGTLVPVIGLVQVGGQAMADRYTYFPLTGIFVMLAWEGRAWLVQRKSRVPLATAAAALALAGCLILTNLQVRYWRDTETLFARAIEVTSDNPVAYTHLAGALARKGQTETAVELYRESLRLGPNQPAAHNNLANLLNALGQTNEALAHLQTARNLKPDDPVVLWNLGLQYAAREQYDTAMEYFSQAARLAPAHPRPRLLSARTQARRGLVRDALVHLEAALRLDPNHLDSLLLLARLRAAEADPTIRNGATAVQFAEHANALSHGQSPAALDILAMAYAEAGRFAEARTALEQAIRLLPADAENSVRDALQDRLRLYQSNSPYRETRAGWATGSAAE